MNKIRIGITTRVAGSQEYTEPRDCLAQDWAEFFTAALPEAEWMMLPNIGSRISAYAAGWGLNAFIISGGNDLGECEKRDHTEACLLEYATLHSHPLLGICRGLQFLASSYGGRLERAATGEHPIAEHPVKFITRPYNFNLPPPARVNSYHNWLVKSSGKLTPFITDSNGNIEGAYSEESRILGIGWHPERSSPSADFDYALIRAFFLQE